MCRPPLLPLLLLAFAPFPAAAQPAPAASSAFNTYVATVESRLAQQHRSASAFLAPSSHRNRTACARAAS